MSSILLQYLNKIPINPKHLLNRCEFVFFLGFVHEKMFEQNPFSKLLKNSLIEIE